MNEELTICPVCQRNADIQPVPTKPVGHDIDCNVCGKFWISISAQLELNESKYSDKRYIISGYIREAAEDKEKLKIDIEAIDHIINSSIVPSSPLESIDKLILYIHNKSETADEFIKLNDSDYPIAYAKNESEFMYFWSAALKLEYLEIEAGPKFRLGVKGWERIDELGRRIIDSKQAFVAMWFHEKMENAWEDGFKKAFQKTGYKPIKMDLVEHNEQIDNRIIAEIRRSGLLVADFTNNRGGVYFEAGFALGLGIPVIWTCHNDYIEDVHFDTRQYNHIFWANPKDLREQLHNRIIATMPKRGLRRFV